MLVDFDAYVPVLAGDTKHLSLNVKHPSLDWPATWKARILRLPAASGKIGIRLIFYSEWGYTYGPSQAVKMQDATPIPL